MSEESRNDGTIRLLFEISRADNPPLYDHLIQFGKGVKRVNRLRLLAHEGLRAVSAPAQSFTGWAPQVSAEGGAQTPEGLAFAPRAVTDLVFADPLDG